MVDVVNLNARQQHATVIGGDTVYIVPIDLVRRIASGQVSLPDVPEPAETLRAIAILAMERINSMTVERN